MRSQTGFTIVETTVAAGTSGIRARDGRSGLSVLELITTVAITSTLIATGLPNVSRTLQAYNLRGAAREMFAQLQTARVAAVTHNVHYRINQVSGSTHTYTVQEDLNANGIADAGEPITTFNIYDRAPGVASSFTGPISFAPNGTASSFGTITLTNRFGDSRSVDVNAAGRIQID